MMSAKRRLLPNHIQGGVYHIIFAEDYTLIFQYNYVRLNANTYKFCTVGKAFMPRTYSAVVAPTEVYHYRIACTSACWCTHYDTSFCIFE